MRVSLNQECSLIVPIELGAKYVIYVCPIMTSIARTLDVEQVRSVAINAYEHLTGAHAPSKFGIELKCASVDKMEFVPVKIVPFNEAGSLISRVPKQTNTMYSYLQKK